ncbi:MAG: NAD(P)-dependent alcohol dehydrogenase [Pseudomonadota bacterium]
MSVHAVELKDKFGFDSLVKVVRPREKPGGLGSNEVRVKICATSVNYRDLLIISGMYNPKLKLPIVPLSDGAGVVTEVGEGVTKWAVGDRVIPAFHQNWNAGAPTREKLEYSLGSPLDGVCIEERVFPAGGLLGCPDHLSFREAASLPCAAVTAWTSLIREAALQPGETVVIQGTGGVALFALQFAKLMGAWVILLSSSDEKLERGQALGADYALNYRSTPEWAGPVREITHGQGADVIIELGGTKTLEQSLKAIAIGGRIPVIGVLSGAAVTLPLTRILMQHVKLQGITVGSHEDASAMLAAIDMHKLHPVLDQNFGFFDVHGALMALGAGKHFGKMTLSHDN